MARILVVDDNATNRKLVRSLLSSEGHLMFEAANGIEGLALARAEIPDLVISDVLMPVMDGYEFVRRLRAEPQLANVVVVFHTAHYLDRSAQELARSCKVARILPKPCDSAQLLGAVHEVLQGHVDLETEPLTDTFASEHLRLLTDKLAQKVGELQEEVEEHKQARERVQKLNRFYALLSGINSLIVRATAREELCQEACRLATQEGNFQIAWIGLRSGSDSGLAPFAWAGQSPDLRRFAEIAATGSTDRSDIVSAALDTRTVEACNDLRDATDFIPYRAELLGNGHRGVAVLPLVVGDSSVGCLMLVTDTPGLFDEQEMRLLAELAGDIAFALDHIGKSERLDYLAYYDALTGLANRKLFEDRLAQHVLHAHRRSTGVAVVILDIERLDSVNDSLGRHVGDELLRQAAERFVHCVGSAKDVGRLGSDHLGAVVEDMQTDGGAIRLIEGWYREWSSTAFVVEGHEISLTAKFGIALFPGDGTEAETLLRNAEAALKKAKGSAERHAFFTQHLSRARSEWLALESKLRRALPNEEFILHYQPKVDLETRRLKGVEALIRWQSPELGLVAPGKFVPILEETGLIAEVGQWVIRQASTDRSRWLERRLPAPRVAVNVSTVQLSREDFVRTTAQALRLAGGSAGIDIEVTESLLMSDVEANIAKLTRIRELGVNIAIDDFGTSYSSLGYLAKLPVETLKIDRSFVSAMLDDPIAMTLVSTIISLAHALKLEVVAEGVESEEQAKLLRLLRCEQMQGYLVSKPLSFDDMTAWLGRSR